MEKNPWLREFIEQTDFIFLGACAVCSALSVYSIYSIYMTMNAINDVRVVVVQLGASIEAFLALFKKNFDIFSDKAFKVFLFETVAEFGCAGSACLLFGMGQMSGHRSGACAGPRGIGEDMHLRKGTFFNECKSRGKIIFGFAGEADNQVGCNGTAREVFAQQRAGEEISLGVILAVHILKGLVAAALK